MKPICHICIACGISFTGRSIRKYCSRYCANTSRSPANKGILSCVPSPRRNGIQRKCLQCGESFYVSGYRVNKAQFCSISCRSLHRWGESRTITVSCKICSKLMTKFKSDDRACCSKECSAKYKSQNYSGTRSHFWRGGNPSVYGSDWKSIRKQALERDGWRCVFCTKTEKLSVHHIIPYRYCKCHELDNLVTVCRSCHSKEEWKANSEFANNLKQRWHYLHRE